MSIVTIYQQLASHYGKQQWWPADTPFEVMIGAVLTQNTSWNSVEKAINNLKDAKILSPNGIAQSDHQKLGELIRPSGYFNQKAERLHRLVKWYFEHGEMDGIQQRSTIELRESLLSLNGIGPETADDILLYAFERPVFVIDAYTRRIFSRYGLINGKEKYEQLRILCEDTFAAHDHRVSLFNEFHALIVSHAKMFCKTKPVCSGCPLIDGCQYGKNTYESKTD